MVVRIAGVSGGVPQIVKAIADSFTNSLVVGIAVIDIPNATASAVAITGVVAGLDTSLLSAGQPYYLSDTVAGALTTTAPAIRTRVGGVLVADASVGQFRLDIAVNQNTPSVLGGLKDQATPLYAVTTTAQDIVGYTTTREVVTTVNATTGEITLPHDGDYRVHVTAAITFPSSTSTRSITIELYDAAIRFPYVKNIPKSATEDSLSFSWTLEELAGNVHKLRIKSSTAIAVTFTNLSFDIESISIS